MPAEDLVDSMPQEAYERDAYMHCIGMLSVDVGDSMLTDSDARGVVTLEDSNGCVYGAAVRRGAPHKCICRCIFGGVGTLAYGLRLGPIEENLPD